MKYSIQSLSCLLCLLLAIFNTQSVAQNSKSFYTEQFNDPEGLDVTPENFNITSDGKR